MNRTLKPLLLALVAAVWLSLASTRARGDEWLVDSANLFSPPARQQAASEIREVQEHFHTELRIETFARLPADQKRAYDEAGTRTKRSAVFADWAAERAADLHVAGVYILICKDPLRVRVVARPKGQEQVFDTRRRLALQRLFERNFEHRRYDNALREAVAFVRDAEVEEAARPVIHLVWPIWVLVGLLGAWLVTGVVRNRLPPQEDSAGSFIPSAGNSLLGGTLGIMGGFWLWDALRDARTSGREVQAPGPNSAEAQTPAAQPAEQPTPHLAPPPAPYDDRIQDHGFLP